MAIDHTNHAMIFQYNVQNNKTKCWRRMPQTPDEQLHCIYKSFGVFIVSRGGTPPSTNYGVFHYFEKKLSKFNS